MTDQELIEKLITAVNDFANLNCARPPLGKLWNDDDYCGTCTSCRARNLMKEIGRAIKFHPVGGRY